MYNVSISETLLNTIIENLKIAGENEKPSLKKYERPYSATLSELEKIRKESKDKIVIVWCLQDVIEHAKQVKMKITKEEARDVLAKLDNDHDCTIGINWDVISDTITNYQTEKKG